MELTSTRTAQEYVNDTVKLNNIIQATDPLVSASLLYFFTMVLDLWMSLILSIFGVFSNVLTLVVFAKLGFKDTVNITMTAITAWDLIRVLSGALHRMYGPISMFSEVMGKSWQNLTVPNVLYLQVIAGSISYVIGGYVALERCLCVIAPFKVKSIITPKITTGVCLTISLLVFTSLFPTFLVFSTTWVYSSQYGQFIGIYQYSEFYIVHGEKYLPINRCLNFLYPMISLVLMVVSTVIISYHLVSSTKFRHKFSAVSITNSNARNQLEQISKDRKVVKMLLVVIALYMVSLIPRLVNYVAMLSVEEYFIYRYYNNIFWVILYVLFYLDFVNSSCNLFIFYSMSSKFRQSTKTILCRHSLPNSKQKVRNNQCSNI